MSASFCQPCAAMIMPTITRTTSKATSESRAGSERPNTLILTLLLLRSKLERDVLPFLRLELISVYGHWCAEFPRTLIFHRIAEKAHSRKPGFRHTFFSSSFNAVEPCSLALWHGSLVTVWTYMPRRLFTVSANKGG